jgi:glycosyltransferase involved in cell wall biosynthesis
MPMSGAPGGPIDVTVLIATRNRADRIGAALAAVAGQRTGGMFAFEILVADNGSTDGTRRAVEAFAAASPVPVRYLYEPRPGKPYAVNTALAQARGRLVAFTDDDVRQDGGWLAALRGCFEATGADAVLGKILPDWQAERPAWMTNGLTEAFVFGALGCVDHGEARLESTLERPLYWVGGNIALRADVARRLGGYDARMVRAQDTELLWRCMRRGHRVMYEPSAVVHHAVTADRLTPAHFRNWWTTRGYYRALRTPWKRSHLVLLESPGWYARTGREALRWLLSRSSGQRLLHEVRLREQRRYWAQRLRLLPAMWAAAARGTFRAGLTALELEPDRCPQPIAPSGAAEGR